VGRLLHDTSRPAEPAVQRTVTILSYDVGKGGPYHAELNLPAVRTAIQGAVKGPNQATILARLATANTQNWTGGDVVVLATHLCAGTPVAVTTVADAIGSTLLLTYRTNAEEAQQFEQARAVANSMSRSKGTPNQIALATLDGALGSAGIAGIKQAIGVLDAKLGTRQDAVAEATVDSWPDILAGALNVREVHGNGAGWLPTVDIATPLAAYQGIVDNAYAAAAPGWIAAKGEAAVRFSLINSNRFPTSEARRYYVWASKAQGISPYIEFSVPGHKDLRVVFDFVNRQYYFTVHYKWYKGYNPFFLII
jgi:hypothetical protein